MAAPPRRRRDGDVEQVHLVDARHRDAVADQVAVDVVQRPRRVAGDERVDEVAARPRKRIDLVLELEHAVERGDRHRPDDAASSRALTRARAGRAHRFAPLTPRGRGGLRRSRLARAARSASVVGDLVAHVERQRERGIDGAAVAPGLLGEAQQRARASASPSGTRARRRRSRRRAPNARERVAGDDARRRVAPARGERVAVGQDRRDARRPARRRRARTRRRRSGPCARPSAPRRAAPARRARASSATASRLSIGSTRLAGAERQALRDRAGGAQAGERAGAAAERDRVEIGERDARLRRAGRGSPAATSPMRCAPPLAFVREDALAAPQRDRHALGRGVEGEQRRHRDGATPHRRKSSSQRV